MALKSGSIIGVNEFLSTNDNIKSPDGLYFAIMQDDGNFCIYRGSGPNDIHYDAMWHTKTARDKGEYFAFMQGDGNFCVYRGTGPEDRHGGAVWCSKSFGSGGKFFAWLQDDGNFSVHEGTSPENRRNQKWNNGFSDPVDDLDIKKIDYDTDNAEILSGGTTDLDIIKWANHDSEPFPYAISQTYEVEEISSWSDSLKAKAGVETTFKTGIPLFADGEIKVSVEVENTYTWSGSKKRTKS